VLAKNWAKPNDYSTNLGPSSAMLCLLAIIDDSDSRILFETPAIVLVHALLILCVIKLYQLMPRLLSSGGQNDDFRPLTYTLGGRSMGCRDKYVTS
jgi:hypothetical protein